MDIASETDENEGKELALETVCLDEDDTSAFKAAMGESFVMMGNPKNPLLLSPVIQCLLKFLNFEEIKNFRFVCREWSSAGKLALASRSLISFDNYYSYSRRDHRPADFQACFLESAALFSAFKISGYLINNPCEIISGPWERIIDLSDLWTIGELTKFFHEQQQYIKELSLKVKYFNEIVKKKIIDLGPWLSKCPLVQKDAKHLTKLSIGKYEKMLDLPLHLIMHIKDVSLSKCRISLETGIKICPIKLNLSDATFYRNGIKVDHVLLNDIMDFSKAKEISLLCTETEETLPYAKEDATIYAVDLRGTVNLEKLSLSGVSIVNGEISHWVIGYMRMIDIPYSLNSQMKINELCLNVEYSDSIDLSTLPATIEKLILKEVAGETTLITCVQPLVLENLQHLEISHGIWPYVTNFSFLSYFTNCPKLNSLSFGACEEMEVNSSWMPKSLKILTLDGSIIKRLDDRDWNLGTLVIEESFAKDHCKTKINVDDVVLIWKKAVEKSLVDFLEDQKRLNFGKRLFIGELKWGEEKLEDSVLNGYVDAKSQFYVFQNGEKGRALSKEAFHHLVDIPKHTYI